MTQHIACGMPWVDGLDPGTGWETLQRAKPMHHLRVDRGPKLPMVDEEPAMEALELSRCGGKQAAEAADAIGGKPHGEAGTDGAPLNARTKSGDRISSIRGLVDAPSYVALGRKDGNLRWGDKLRC